MPDDISTPFSLINPVNTEFSIINPFNSPCPHANGRHEGVDLRAIAHGKAVEVLAARRGIIEIVGLADKDYGNYVRILHEEEDGTKWVTWYAHLASVNPNLAVDTYVEEGYRLGVAGAPGNVADIHLHFALQRLGDGGKGYLIPDVVDPVPYIRGIIKPVLDELVYVNDLTVPDGSSILAGKSFKKTWRVRNNGSVTWQGYYLEHVSDERMDGPKSVPLPPLQPNESGEVSLNLVAPSTPGRHRSTWKPRNALGHLFQFELFTDILVTPAPRRDDAVLIGDVTLPPATKVEKNRMVLKTWRVRNTGDSVWDKRYSLVALDGHANKPAALSLPTIKPGGTAALSIELRMPDKTGAYRSRWQLQDPEGNGFGPILESNLIVVKLAGSQWDDAALIADLTVPDKKRMQPGAVFNKIWRIKNTGDKAWGPGYSLVASATNTISSTKSIPLPQLEPGSRANISIELTAPTSLGLHRATWQPHTAAGFPFGDILHVEIEIVRLGTVDNAGFVADVTYPDGAVVSAGESIKKTWQIRNSGSSAWGPGYSLTFVGENKMDGPDSVSLPAILPGETAKVTIALRIPSTPGRQRSAWRARNPEGALFGDIFYVDIQVPFITTPDSPMEEDAQLEEHITVPDGTEIRAGAQFEKIWAIRNTGSTSWTAGYELAFFGGATMGDAAGVAVEDISPSQVTNVAIKMTAPEENGRFVSSWRMRNPRGEFFGSTFFASITTINEQQKVDMLPFLRGDGRLYEVKYIFSTAGGLMTGQQRMQTQFDGQRFYQTKNSEWEEMWSDERFIYRGTDTSPGSGNFYTLMDGERYGSAWIPRKMAVGQLFRRSALVTSRRKNNCTVNTHLSGRHVTWIKMEAIHSRLTLPDAEGRPGLGIQIRDVVVLAAFNEVNGRSTQQPFERYYYAKGFGLIMWEGIETDHRGQSFLVEIHNPGARPNNVRENIPCLNSLRP